MKTKQEMIDLIYDKVADKTLNFGCLIKSRRLSLYGDKHEIGKTLIVGIFYKQGNINIKNFKVMNNYTEELEVFDFEKDLTEYEILGHPVMIGDILEIIYNKLTWLDGKDKEQYRADLLGLMSLWEYKRKFLEEQSEDCIIYLFNYLGLGTSSS